MLTVTDGRITEDQIRDLVHTFYAEVQRDPELGPVFDSRLHDRWEPHLERMCDFWSSVLLGTRRFQGDPMGKHVGIPGISSALFSRWMELFQEVALARLPEHIARDIVARAGRMRVALERVSCPAHPSQETQPGASA